MWTNIARLILKFRVGILVGVILATVIMGYLGRDVGLSWQYAQMLPQDDSSWVEYKNFRETFGEEPNVIVVGIQDSTFYELDKFNEWYDLTEYLGNVKGVSGVLSVPQMVHLKANRSLKKFETERVFEKKPKTQEELDSLKNIVYSLPFYNGILVNDTSHVILLMVTIEKSVMDSEARVPLIDKVKEEVDAYGEKYDISPKYSGLPYIRTCISNKIREELNLFIYLSLIVSILVLYLFFKSFKAVFFSILVVICGVILVMGTMSLFGYNITVLTGLIPSLLIVIGIPNCIFLLNKYHFEYRSHGNKIKALQRSIQKIGSAIFLTNLTTASGFATFILTRSEILQEFGIVASLNIIGVFFLAIFLIPVIFSFLPPPLDRHTKHLDRKIVKRMIEKLVYFTLYKRKSVYSITAIILVCGIVGIYMIKTTGYMVDDIPHDDDVYVDLKFFEKHLGGVLPIEISIDTKKRNGVYKLSTIKKIEKLNKKLSSYDELSRTISISDLVKFSRQGYFKGKKSAYKLPSNMEKNFIMSYATKDTGRAKILNTFIDSTKSITKISVQMSDVGTVKMKQLFMDIQADIDSVFSKEKYETVLTGSSVIFYKGTKYLIKNLFISLFLAIVLISIFMAIMFSSFRMILVSLVPNLIPLFLTAALMGFFGISIKPSTILVFSIAFGISVDDTIHFLAKYRQELKSRNWAIGESVIAAIRETGVSMAYTSIVLFFGFGIFIASDFGGTVALGILVSITLLIAMLANLVLLPALLLSLERSITTKAFEEPLIHIFDEEKDIELESLINGE